MIKEEIIEYAIADASLEVLNGNYSRSELSVMLNKQQLLTTAIKFLSLTYIGLLFYFCWRSLRFALTTQKAVSHGPLPRLLSAVEVTPHGPPTQVSMATPRKLSKIKADYYS